MSEREFSEEERAQYAEEGTALPDGSYPQPDCDAVRRAIDAYGRAPESHRADLAALIRQQNEDLQCGYRLEELAGPGAGQHQDQEGDHGSDHDHDGQ
jgi:hypothetical protein